jgi:glycosyltransferase involved in cell wall biosynthesis
MSLSGVTVVTPTLNAGKYLRETLQSIANQDCSIEHIVVDGGSTDDTIPTLIDFNHPWIYCNRGQAASINEGIKAGSGEIVTWLNGDDTYLPGAVSWALGVFGIYPNAAVIYGDTVFVDECGGLICHSSSSDFDYYSMVADCRNPIPQPSAFIRRSVFDYVGGLDSSLHYFFDWDLWMRIGAIWPIIHGSRAISTYRLHSESKTSSSFRYAHELEYIYRKSGIKNLSGMYAETARYYAHGGDRVSALRSLWRAFRHGMSMRKTWRKLWSLNV